MPIQEGLVDASHEAIRVIEAVPITTTISAPLGVSGTISIGNSPSVSQTAGPWAVSGTVTVAGAKSSNAGVADGTNLGVLPAVANAASPAYIEGNQVSLSTDLAGNLRVVTSGTVAITSGPSLISTVNSSTAPLSGSGTFTGGWEDVSGYSAIVVSVFTDQASASGGLSPQFSSNGVNADFSGVHAITPSGGVYSFSPRARYFRLVYMNGAVAQGTFRLQTIYHPLAILPFTISPMVPTGDPNPTTQRVAANLQVRNPNDGTWQAVAADASGRVVMTGAAAAGSPVAGNPVMVGGVDPSGSVRGLLLNTDGSQPVGGFTASPSGSLTRSNNTTTYSASTVVNTATGSTAVITFANCVRANGKTAWVQGAQLLDMANQTLKGQFELYLFRVSPATVQGDNIALAITNADLQNLVAVIPFNTSYVTNAGSAAAGNVVFFDSLSKAIPFTAVGTSLFGVLVVRNTYVPVANEAFSVCLQLAQD